MVGRKGIDPFENLPEQREARRIRWRHFGNLGSLRYCEEGIKRILAFDGYCKSTKIMAQIVLSDLKDLREEMIKEDVNNSRRPLTTEELESQIRKGLV